MAARLGALREEKRARRKAKKEKEKKDKKSKKDKKDKKGKDVVVGEVGKFPVQHHILIYQGY
jgi:hypothetical protein